MGGSAVQKRAERSSKMEPSEQRRTIKTTYRRNNKKKNQKKTHANIQFNN